MEKEEVLAEGVEEEEGIGGLEGRGLEGRALEGGGLGLEWD